MKQGGVNTRIFNEKLIIIFAFFKLTPYGAKYPRANNPCVLFSLKRLFFQKEENYENYV